MFQAKWTDAIHEEWIRNLLHNRPDLSRERLERTRDSMNTYILDSLVTRYEELIPSLQLPDENDRHVLAAAIRGSSSVIVTYNLKDFPESVLSSYGIEAQHPDEFILSLLQLDEEQVCETIRKQRIDLKNPPKTATDILDTFDTLGLKRTADSLRSLISSL